MADNIFPCIDCGREYNHTKLSSCPSCSEVKPTIVAGATLVEDNEISRNSAILQALEKSIQASNRTTHAVRAFTSYFGVLIVYGMISGLFYGLGLWYFTSKYDTEGLFWVLVITIAILTFGSFHALSRFLTEWRLSKVPGAN